MTGILVVAHGSRAKETEETLIKVIDMLKESLADRIIEFAFMEFSEKDIYSGIKSLVDRGVKDIKVVPYFLFSGIHIKEDIPLELEKAIKNYTDVKVTMTKTLGADRRLAEILIDRIEYSSI